MFALSNQDLCPASILRDAGSPAGQHAFSFQVPQLQDSDEEFLLGLNEILDELHPSSDHGPLSGAELHLHK